ncbi:MAG: LacI family DNA-binding transcriptional regulator [bacterium]
MNNPVTIRDVARAAGVSISTVSFVVNGKADRYRIGRDTQARILATVRQLGYSSMRGISDERFKINNAEHAKGSIGLALSAISPPDSLAMILAMEPILAAAGYHLGVNVIPADPVAARERVSQLLHDEVSGIVCCSSIYPVVSAMVGRDCPVLVLGQGAGNAMVASLQAGSGQSSVGSGQLAGSSSTGDPRATS